MDESSLPMNENLNRFSREILLSRDLEEEMRILAHPSRKLKFE